MQIQMTEEQRLHAEAAFAQKLNVLHHAYIDMSGDLVAGALLGQILYWLAPQKDGSPRARIQKDGRYWIAKARTDWWEEIRISPKQYDRAVKILEEKGFVETRTMRFDGNPVKHISVNAEAVNAALEKWKLEQVQEPAALEPVGSSPKGKKDIPEAGSSMLTDGEPRSLPLGNNGIHLSGITSYTEITTENVTENTYNQAASESEKPASNEFERIWEHYPKKEGKLKARRAFERSLKGEGLTKADGSPYTADEIFVRVVLYKQYAGQAMEAGDLAYRYIPTGGTWFENEAWADSYPDIAPKFERFEDGMEYTLQANKMRLMAEEIARSGNMAMRQQIESIAASMPY